MSEYKAVPVKFANKGVVQKVDVDQLGDGMYYDLLNATTIQEGSISSRLGADQLSSHTPGSYPHTLEMFQIEAADDKRFLYIGEGTDIYRLRLSAPDTPFSPASANARSMNAALPEWGKRFSTVKFNVGLAGKPHLFIAGGKMLKDQAIKPDGTTTTDLQSWGTLPPPAAPTVLVDDVYEKTATLVGDPSATWSASSDSAVYKEVPITATAIDLSEFSAGHPSGRVNDGYDSDDYIEVEMIPTNVTKFTTFLLQLDVSDVADADYTHYYQKALIPSQAMGTIDQTVDPLTSSSTRGSLVGSGTLGDTGSNLLIPVDTVDESYRIGSVQQDSVTVGSKPVELPPVSINESAPPLIVARVKKSEFLKVGDAGTEGKTWADVKRARLYAQAASISGGTDQTVTVYAMALRGGGGLNNADAGYYPYEWIYTFRNDATGHESNPCPLMVSDAYVKKVQRRSCTLYGLYGSNDPQVTSLVIYRRGGAYSGSEYRRVGFIDDPGWSGSNPVATQFTDSLSDADIQYAPIAEFDNDPPVPSKLPTSLMATFTGNSNVGFQTVALSISQPYGVTASDFLTVGTRLFLQDRDKTEDIQIHAISGNNIVAFFQQTHSGTVKVTTSTVCGIACRFAATVGESIIVAGDRNNPSMIYKCKQGRPESFPVVTEASGRVNQLLVSSPSNPILGMTEYAGEGIVMCRNNIYIVRVFNGQLQPPQETPAQRGLLCEKAWCKADNELYYLSDDGVYAWSGGQSLKKSEAIDWFFKGKSVNGRSPLDKDEDAQPFIHMAYFQNEVRLTCRDTDGSSWTWCYNTIYDRWTPYLPATEGADYAGWATMLAAPNGKLYTYRYFTNVATTVSYLYEEEALTADNGASIPFVVQTGFFSMNEPTLQKQWGDVVMEIVAPNDMTVKVYKDFNTSAVIDTFTITGAAGRRRVPLPLNNGSAREAAAVAFRFESSSTSASGVALHSMTFNVLALAHIQRGRASDWDDYGYPHDKRLDQLVIEYDTGGTSVTLNLDTVSGIAGSTQTTAVSTFTLSGAGRSKASLPIKKASDGTPVIAKMMRLRPTVTSADFKIHSATITYEKYPCDITLFTDPSDYGSPFEKYFQQLLIDVDTGGQNASVGVYLDNSSTPSQTLTINTTQASRQQNLTLLGNLSGKKAHLRITPHASGKFQLFGHHFVTLPADKGQVAHTYDWDSLGTPNEKKLIALDLEYEVSQDMDMLLQGMNGVTPDSQTPFTIQTFRLESGGRRAGRIVMPDSTVVKMVRVHPASDVPLTPEKIYRYDFEKIVYPPDVVLFTEWSNYGYPCDKVFQWLSLEIDTGGVDCNVIVEVDGVGQQQFVVNTSNEDRTRILSIVSDITNRVVIGKMARLVLQPGVGGKSQLFGHEFKFQKEPCGLTFFDTFEQYFGSNGYKYMKQAWIEYRSTGPVKIRIFVDGGRLFYYYDLPAHEDRAVERFYLPAVNGGVLNKSKSYRITLTGELDATFYLYRDSSRIETMNLSGDARAPYSQHYLYTEMPIQK
jgi:hypothetical protein